MAAEADIPEFPDPIPPLKIEAEDKEMTSELPNIIVSEGPKEERKKIESWLSQPPEIIGFFRKAEAEEVGNTDEVANMNVINKGSVEKIESDVFSDSLSVADEKPVSYTEHSQMTSGGEKSDTLADSETMSMSSKEASQEKVELAEEMKDSNSVGNELPHKSQESSFFKTIKEVFFHKVDNLETSSKESESGMKDFAKESHHEAGHGNELLENIAAADSDQSTTGMHDEIQDAKADILFGQQRESTADNIVAEEQSGQCHIQKTEQEAPMDFEEIETEGSGKYAETVKNVEEQKPVGSPEEIVGEKLKDKSVDVGDVNTTEVQEANNLPTVDLDEKTRSAELEIPNKSGSESWITHPLVKEEVRVESENQDEVSMFESGDPPEAIQLPNKEEKQVNEASEATERPKSTVSEPTATEGELNVEETSTSEIDSNMEKGCELKSDEALKDINTEDNVEESEQTENAFNAEFFVERKGDDNGKSTIEEDLPVNKGGPLCLEGEEHHHDEEEKVRSIPFDGGDHSYMTQDEINSTDEQIIYQEVCEDSKTADRAEDREKVMHNEENTVNDFSPEPMGECTTKFSEGNEMDTKKHKAEASEGYDTSGESMILEESAITDIPSPDVREEKVEESLKEDRRDTTTSDKEVSESIECRERDSEATHSKEESTVKDLKDEAEANEGLTAQSIMGSSEEETAQESNSNVVQSSSVPDVIEKEVKTELLEKEDSKEAVETEETRLTEAESEYPMRVDSSNLIPEDKDQVKTETSKMRSNDMDIIAESAEISNLGDNGDMNIPTERKDGAVEAAEKTQPESKTETCGELSTEDQREISTIEESSKCMPEQEHLESSTMPLVAHNLVTGVTEPTGEVLEKERALSDKEETPIAAETTGEYIAETEGDSTVQENDTNMGSIDIGRESPIDDALVQELHAPLELDYGKSIPESESDVELLKGVDTSEAANASNMSEQETSNDEKSSHIGVEPDKSEYEEAVHEASQGVEVGGGCIGTENNIIEQENPAKNNEGISKEGVEIEKATGEFESEADGCGSFASETQRISTQTEKKIEMEDRELATELPNVTVNEVTRQEKENTESWLSQPPESIGIPEAESVQVAHDDEVGNVDAVDNVGTTEGESFPKSTLAVDGELNEYSEDDRLNNKEAMSSFQEEEGKAKMVTDKYGMAEASDGQDEGVRIQTPELIGGSSRDVEMLNEVPHEEITESIMSTETTSGEQDLKETSFDREDEKSNTLEMDAEATQPSTDIGVGKNKGEEMPGHGVKDDFISTETATGSVIDEPTESNVGATDKLGSLLVTEPDVCKNLDDSSMACKDEVQETSKLVERAKEDASIEDEAEKHNLESSFVERAENVETSREESKTGMEDIDKEMQKEAENQDETLENATTADIDPRTEGEDVENKERKSYVAAMKSDDSMTRESEDIAPAEAMSVECESRVMVAPGEDRVVAEEQEATETSKHEEHSEQILNQNAEPAKANLGRPSVIASEVFERTLPNDYIESITKVEEEEPVGSQEEILEEKIIAAESNEDGTTEAKNISMNDAGEKTRSEEFNITNNDVNEVYVTPRPVEEPEEDENSRTEVSTLESEEQDKNESETAKENLGSPLIVALEELTTSHDGNAESITNIEEERPVGNPEEIVGEQRSDKIMIADDSNKEEIPDAESLPAVDSDEKARSEEIKIPDNNTREVCVTHPPVEETVMEGDGKQNEVSFSESVDPVHEASASEFPGDEEKDANDSYEASKSSDCNISEPRCYEGEVNTVVATSAKEIPGRSEEEILWQPRNDENMISQIPEAENPSTVDSYVTPTSMEETFLEGGENKNDASMSESRNQVCEASEFPGEEEKESDDRYEATKSPGSNILEDASTEGALNMEPTSTRSDVDTILDKGCEVISADELKELKAEDNLGEDIKQKEQDVDSEFQMPTKSGDKEKSTIKGESLVKNNDPTSTGEGKYHRDQEDEVMSNRSKETLPALDSGEHSCTTSNEINIIDEEIQNEETIQAHEDPQIADSGEDTEDLMKDAVHAVADHSTELTGDHATKCSQENETEVNMHGAEVLQILPTAEVSANIGMQMKEEDCTTKDNFAECYGEEAQKKCTYDEEKKEREPDTVASNIHGSAPLSTTTAECPISDPPSSFTGEEKVEERLKEDRGDEEISEMELSSSHVECIEAVHSTEEREGMASKQEAEATEEFNGQSITEPSLVETTQKERNVDFGENSTSMPEICEREIKEVLGTEDSSVPMVAEESRLTLAEGDLENISGLESADLVFQEKALVPTETSKMGLNAARTGENSISGEDNNVEIPTAREAATVESFETSMDNISEPTLRAPSAPTLEEQNIMSPEVGETTGEAPEKEKKTEKEETSLAEETTEDEREKGYEPTNPIEGTNLGSIDEQKKRENDYAAVKDREFYIPSEQNIESKTESDVELLRRVNTSEVANPNEISKSETVEELKSSETDKSEYDTAITETSEGVESWDTEKSILQEDDSAKKLEGSAEESDEIEKAPVQFEAEMQGSEASKAKSISTPKEENINIVEHDETAVEFPEMNPTNTEEQRHDDENQTITSTDEKVNGQDIQEGKLEMSEEMETKLENQEETNGTQDAILTEKVSTGIEQTSEREKNMEEESCTRELHILPAEDGTFNEVPTVISSSSESEIIKEQIMEEDSCTKELHQITAADDTKNDGRETDLTPQSHEATSSDKNAEMMGSNIAEDLHMESEATQKEVNEPQDAFSTEEVSTETSSAMDEVAYPDLTAIHSVEATSSNKITELMESKTAQDLKESEASPMAEVLEDETKKNEKHVDVSSLVSEGSEEKIKGEKIEDTEKFDDETDITQVVVTDLSSLGQVQLNEEPVKSLDTSSDAESQQTSKKDDVGEQELEETSFIESQLPIHEYENANNAHIHVEKSDAKDLEDEATTITDSVCLSDDQAVKEVHETGSSLNVIEHDTKEIQKQTREVTQVSLEPTDAARDDEIIPGQIPQPEETGEQLQVPSSGLLSDEQESDATTGIGMGSTTKDAVEEAKMRQSEVRIIGAELETTSEGESIENQVQGEENRVQNMSTVSSAEEMDAESSKDNSIITKMSAEEVLESKHGGQDTDEPLKALVISSDTGSLQTTDISDARQQELDETSSVVSQFPVDEHEKSENIRANVDKSDTYDVEEKEIEIPGAVPKPTDQEIQDIQETGTSLPVGEVHTTEIAHQAREVPEVFSKDIKQGVEAVSGNEIIAPVATREVTSLEELQLKQHVEALDTHSIAENPDAIKTVGVSQQDAEFENMNLEENCSMVSHPPIYVHEEEDRENVAPEKSQADYIEVEETVPKSEDQADKEIHEIGTSLNVGDSGTNEIEKPISEVPEALSYAMNQGVDIARNDEITSSQILQDEKLEDQLEAPSTGLLSEEQENETTTTDKKGIADGDDIEGTKILEAEIREELETTSVGKGTGNQVQAEEKRAQDWSTVSSAEELDTKSSIENAMITKMSTEEIGDELENTSEGKSIENQDQGEENRVQNMSTVSSAEEMDAESSKDNSIITKMSAEEVLESKHGGQDTDEPRKALVISSDTGSLQTTDISDARQQELDETSSVVSQFPVDEREKSENIRANVDKSDTYDVEEKEIEIPGAVPKPTDQEVQDIQETGTSLPVGEVPTTEITHQAREVPEAFSKAIKQGVEAVSGDEIIAPVATREVTSLEELQLKQHVEALDTYSIAENPDAIKTVGVSQQDAEFENMNLEETCSMVSHPPIYVHEEEDRENVAPEKSQANYVEVEDTEIPETVLKSQDQADKEIHEIGKSLNVGDSGTNEIEKPISEVPEALSYAMNQGIDIARNDEITSSQILQDEKLEDQLEAPSSGLLSEEQENETTTTDKKGIADGDDIEGTKILEAEIREELETTSAGKGIGNQVQAEEKRAQDWSKVTSAEELDTKSSIENAMITKMSTEEVLEPDHGGHDTDEHLKALDTSSDTERLQTTQTPDASQQELEETSSMVSQLPVHTYEKADNESVTEEKSVGYDADVKEINLPSVVPDSNDQRTTEIEEVGTSVKETRTEEMETQIREVCDALPEDVNQARETVSGDEITSPSEAIEVTSLGEHQIKDEHVDAPDTNKRGDASQQDEEFDNMKHEETSSLESQLPIHEHEKEESANITVEKTDANDVEVEEAEIPDTAPESEELVVKEIQETGTRLATGGADTNAIEKQKRGVPEALSEPINPCFDTSRDYEMTPVKNLQDEKIEEELQVTTSALLSKEEDGETLTAIQKGSTDKDGTQVGSLELQENSGPVFQLPVTEFNSGNNVIEEKSDADIVELNETKAMDAVSDSKDQFFEVAEDTEIDKVDDEIKQVTERIPDLRYIGVDAATGDENLEHDIPLGKLEEQIQLSSSSYESTKEEAAELDKSELEKTTDTSELPTDYGIHHVGTTMKKSESGEVLVEEDKTSKAIPESKGDDFYEFKEIGPSPPVEKIRLDEVQEETKAVPETIFEPTHQGAQTAIHVETAINQTVTTLGAEQLLETESTTQKPCSQDERQRELEVSNLEGSQNISPDEENTGLEKRPTDASSQYEERPIQQSLEEASTDEDIVYSKNSNKDAEEHLTEDIGGKYEEVSNLEFEKNEEVLLESVAAINSAAVPPTSEGIKVIEETPKENKTEVGNGGNHCEETNQEEAIEKYISTEKISEEMQGSRNFDKISLQEEMATEANQEDELRAEDYPGERTSTIFDASRNEIPHERVFKESEEECVDKHMEGMVRADDKGPHQVSASDEIANQSELESHGDETDFTGTATQLKSSEAMLVSQEVERTGGDDEETEISRDGQLQNTDLVVPPVADAAAEETGNGKELETFNDLSEHDLDPNLGNIEPYEHKGEISTAGTINSESLMDNKKLEHKFLEPGCEEGSGTEDFDLTNKDGSNRPSASSTTAASPETLADEGCEKAVDTKHHHFVSDEPTAEPESVPEEGNGFQLEAHTMDKEPVELPVMTDVAKLDENKMRTITATQEEETPQENEKPNVLPPIMDSEMEVSREAVTMNISEDIQGLEETSIVVPHEQTASKRDPSESIEHANIEGMECGDENRMGKPSEEITEESQMTESAKMSLSDLIQSSGKQKPQVVEDVTQGHELMGNKEEPPNETAETIEAEEEEEAAGHDKKDEGEEGDEHKREDSGSDAPVMVEASRDMDVKIAHKKPHHHNILSGVGSKVKHSLAKVKKAITGGKSSHPKPTSPK